MVNKEFVGLRAKLYEQAIVKYPLARFGDIKAMFEYLDPRKDEKILGLGEGNGYFCSSIAKAVGEEGVYLVTDPSKDQLANLEKRTISAQVKTKISSIEELNLDDSFFDKAWTFGAFHHCYDQTKSMKTIYQALKNGGKLVLCDVFQNSLLAKHFDTIVARYCVTGHEVKFLSEGFAKTLCDLAGFKETEIMDLPLIWRFQSEKDMGDFIYKLHALTNLPGVKEEKIAKTITSCYDILGVKKVENCYELNWPMKVLIAIK
jgi:arsenite methyltransferase